MSKGYLLSLLFFLLTVLGHAQQNRYMVFFKDKSGVPYSISDPNQFLSASAIERRILQGVPVTEEDLPVNQAYVQEVESQGANTFFTTRWLNGVLVQCDPLVLQALEALPFVARIEFVAPNAKLLNNGRRKNNIKSRTAKAMEVTDTQLQMLGLDEMQKAGFKGEGITIAIFDSGFQGVNVTNPFQHVFSEGRIDLSVSQDFVYNSDNVFQYDEHGTEVFSVISAYQEGTFTGGAYEANYQLFVTEEVPTEYRVEEYNWLFAAERADSAGADIIHASLGYYDFDDASMNYTKSVMNGSTTVVSRAAQFAADRGIVVVTSAGNEGNLAWKIITAPADVKDVLAVASVNTTGVRANSSSIGPSADGRIKPDVAALGVSTSVIKPNGNVGTATGTSLSAPLITSLVAGVWQRFPELTNKEVINAIRLSSSQANNPDHLIGYGIPNFKAVVNYVDQALNENIFEVFPNPVSTDTLIVQPFNPNEVTSCRIELLSAQGRKILDNEVNFSWLNRKYTADVSQISAGWYFLRISWGDKLFTYKLIKI